MRMHFHTYKSTHQLGTRFLLDESYTPRSSSSLSSSPLCGAEFIDRLRIGGGRRKPLLLTDGDLGGGGKSGGVSARPSLEVMGVGCLTLKFGVDGLEGLDFQTFGGVCGAVCGGLDDNRDNHLALAL